MYRKKLNIWITRFCMRISTWNKNSVRFRIANALRFLKEFDIYVMCLQEAKKNKYNIALNQVSCLFKEFGFTAGMLKEALAKGHGKK